jgi:hypothetical protein
VTAILAQGKAIPHGVKSRTCICHCNAAYDTGMQALHLHFHARMVVCLVTGVLCIAHPRFTEANVILCAAFICLQSAVTTNQPITPA